MASQSPPNISDDQEETLVLNYLDEDFGTSMDTNDDTDDITRLNGSFDENQNAKVHVKGESIKATPQQARNLRPRLSKSEVTPKRILFANKKAKNGTTNGGSVTPNITPKARKKKSTPKETKNLQPTDCNQIKVNDLKSPVLKSTEGKSLPQKELASPTPKGLKNTSNNNTKNDSNAQTLSDTVIKVEHDDDDQVVAPTSPKGNLIQHVFREPEDIDVKYETVQQIHTEFKYESLSETEEVIKKKKQAITTNVVRNNSLKTSKKPHPVTHQTTLDKLRDKFYKVIDLKLKCNFPNAFQCKQCLYVGNSKANLERHTLIHMDPSDILWYKCTECDYKSKYDHQLKSHAIVHKNPDEILYFQCPHCDLKCSRKHNLTNHIKGIHSNRINNFKCAECNYSTFSKDRLVAHIGRHSREVFTCNICKFVTKREKYLENHFKYKHTQVNRPFPCDTCSYKGKTKRELVRHYDRMHNKEKLHEYKCSLCGFASIYKKNLEFHLLHMHLNSEGFQKFICGHCQKEFAYKNGLKTHIMRMHLKLTDDDWQKCQECKYKSKDVCSLKRHIKRNHGAPKLHCKECSFATNRQLSMTAHLKTHEDKTSTILKCSECPYRIIQATSFTYHMKVLHGKSVSAKNIHRYYLKDE